MASWGIETSSGGYSGFLDAGRPNEVVLGKARVNYNANPIWTNTYYGCNWPIEYNGQYHVPVAVTIKKTFPGQYYLTGYPRQSYFKTFKDCTLVVGDSAGRSVGYYGGDNHSQVVTPCGYSKAIWSEDANNIYVKYFGVYSGTESSWRSSSRMSGTLYVMLVGQLPSDNIQELPEYGIQMLSTGGDTTFNSNYEPSNPRYFVGRPPFDLNNSRAKLSFKGDMGGGTKMTTPSPIAYCHSGGSQVHYNKVYPCFSSDGRRMGTRTQGWATGDSPGPGNARGAIMGSSEIMRIWQVSDYF